MSRTIYRYKVYSASAVESEVKEMSVVFSLIALILAIASLAVASSTQTELHKLRLANLEKICEILKLQLRDARFHRMHRK